MSYKKRFSEIQCPLCKKKFKVRKGNPRTLKQWKISLIVHLTASLKHRLALEKAEFAISKYFKSLEE